MSQYTWLLPGRPRAAGGPPRHHHADQPVDKLVDRRFVGAVGHLLAQAEDHVMSVRGGWVYAFHRLCRLLSEDNPRPEVGPRLNPDNGSRARRLERTATDPHRRPAAACGPPWPLPERSPRPPGGRRRPRPGWRRWWRRRRPPTPAARPPGGPRTWGPGGAPGPGGTGRGRRGTGRPEGPRTRRSGPGTARRERSRTPPWRATYRGAVTAKARRVRLWAGAGAMPFGDGRMSCDARSFWRCCSV